MFSISVLISVYKSEKPAYLKRSLDSIWDDQILKPKEIILVEDGLLTAELYEVIENFKNKVGDALKLIVNKTNIGLTKSLNKGIKVATGDYIARMDSDDISLPDRFLKQAEFLEANKEICVVGGYIQEFDNEHVNLNVRRFPLSHEDALDYIYKASPLAHPTVMMRNDIFKKGIKYDEKYRTSQDVALWFTLINAGYRIANLDMITLKFRREGDVFKRRSREKAKNELLIYCKGIRQTYGLLSWKYMYPLARYIFRNMPIPLVKKIYGSSFRNKILE